MLFRSRKYVEAFAADDSADGYMGVTDFVDDEKPLYVATDDNLRVTGFHDSFQKGVKYISGGIYGLTSPALGILEDCMAKGVSRMRNYQRALVGNGLDLRAFPFSKIVDVDHAADIETAEEFIRSGK